MNQPLDPSVYVRRRVGVGAAALAVVVLLVGLVVAIMTAGGGTDRLGAIDPPSSSTTTTQATRPTNVVARSANATDRLSGISEPVPATTTTVAPTTTTKPTTTTTTTTLPPPTTVVVDGVPVWPPYEVLPPLDGVAALTGLPADAALTRRPILAVKIDNHSGGRPQWGLDAADAIIEENVEGVTRFVGLFHSNLPDRVGPVRSARTGDLDIFAGMNRPIVAWSGGNAGVTRWMNSAAQSRLLVDFTALRNPCYERSSSRGAPHNLLLDPGCAVNTAFEPGPARPLWKIDGKWKPSKAVGAVPDSSFDVLMDGVRVTWTWDPERQLYLRSQNGQPHVAVNGAQIAMNTVVELYTNHPVSPVDARSPNPETIGGGRAVIHRDGVAIEGVWGRTLPYDAFGFADRATGKAVTLDQGRTFIELIRADPNWVAPR